MTVFPIVERELRARARSRGSYWGRCAAGAVGLLVSVPPLLWSAPFARGTMNGRGAFYGLVATAFLLCCTACLLTADVISSERREGTLGLLLLTRVRIFDVLAGKFASVGLISFLVLLALLPVIMIPLMTGGVAGGEAMRDGLALIDTLFMALSLGLWVSSRGFERFRTMRTALGTMAALVLLPPVVGFLTIPDTPAGLVASPLGTLVLAADSEYKASPIPYWVSLFLVHALGWFFLLCASGMRRTLDGDVGTMEDSFRTEELEADYELEAPRVRPDELFSIAGAAPVLKKCRYCGRENNPTAVYCHECGTELYPKKQRAVRYPPLSSQPSPLHWLLRRQRNLKPLLWVGATVGFFHLLLFGSFFRFGMGMGLFFFRGFQMTIGFATTMITASLFAFVASRFFVEARRTGELELLLTTSVGAKEIISAQWAVLKRLLVGPVLLMLVPVAFPGFALLFFGFGRSNEIYFLMTYVFTIVDTLFAAWEPYAGWDYGSDFGEGRGGRFCGPFCWPKGCHTPLGWRGFCSTMWSNGLGSIALSDICCRKGWSCFTHYG